MIINCPECGHQTSDKAPTCPNCGVEIAGKIKICTNCRQAYFTSDKECPQCNPKRKKQNTANRKPWHSAVMIAAVSVFIFCLSKPIGAYQSGERFAETVGVHVHLLQLGIIVLSSLLSGVVTAFAGPVSFVGVAVPFIVRTLMRDRRPLAMLPALFLTGAVFTLISDLLARMLLSPMELSLSTVTSVLGAPLVLIMMVGRKKEREI